MVSWRAPRSTLLSGVVVVLIGYVCQDCLADVPLSIYGSYHGGLSLEETGEDEDTTTSMEDSTTLMSNWSTTTSMEESEDPAEEFSTWIYVCELLLVMFLAWCFEQGQDMMNESFEEMGREGEQLRKMFDVMSNEIMILGFISLLVWVCTKTEVALDLANMIYKEEIHKDDELAEKFELVHMVIFAVMVCFIAQCVILMYRAVYLPLKRWVVWENTRVGSFQVFRLGDEVSVRVKTAIRHEMTPGTVTGLKPLKVKTVTGQIIESPIWRDIAKEHVLGEGDRSVRTAVYARVKDSIKDLTSRGLSRKSTAAEVEEEHSGALSVAQLLQEHGYADASGAEIKCVNPIIPAWKRIFMEGKVIGFLQWRLMRHDFLFPAHHAHSGATLAAQTPDLYVPPDIDPHYFQFHQYLLLQLGYAFENLIEVDLITWGVTCLLCFSLPLLSYIDSYWYTLIALGCTWTLLLLMYIFGVHVYSIYNSLTVYDEDNLLPPEDIVNRFKGTSAAALKRRHRRRRISASANAPVHRFGDSKSQSRLSQEALSQHTEAAGSEEMKFEWVETWRSDNSDSLSLQSPLSSQSPASPRSPRSPRSPLNPKKTVEFQVPKVQIQEVLKQEDAEVLHEDSGPALLLDAVLSSRSSHSVDTNEAHNIAQGFEKLQALKPQPEDEEELRQKSDFSQRFQMTASMKRVSQHRPGYLRFLSSLRCCGVKLLDLPKVVPNTQDQLFFFHEASPPIYYHAAGDLIFLQSVMFAMYVVMWYMLKVEWDLYQWSMYLLGLTAPVINVYWLAPKVVSKLATVTSVGFMKSKKCIDQVTFDTKKHQLLESIRLLKVARFQGKIQRIADESGRITEEKRMEYAKIFESFSQKKKADIKHMFDLFDEDASGSISFKEMEGIFQTIDTSFVESANKTWEVIDSDGDGEIDWAEFQVLMALVFHKGDDASRREELEVLYDSFDDDHNGYLTLSEMRTSFETLGVEIDEVSLAMLVSQIFRQSKRKMKKEDFVHFLEELEEMAEKS